MLGQCFLFIDPASDYSKLLHRLAVAAMHAESAQPGVTVRQASTGYRQAAHIPLILSVLLAPELAVLEYCALSETWQTASALLAVLALCRKERNVHESHLDAQ